MDDEDGLGAAVAGGRRAMSMSMAITGGNSLAISQRVRKSQPLGQSTKNFSADNNIFGTGSSALAAMMQSSVYCQAPRDVSQSLKAHDGHGLAVCFRPNGKKLASSGADGYIKLWDHHLSQDFKQLRMQSKSISQVTFNFDGSLIAVSDNQHQINILRTKPSLQVA